jgi:hypothetical protein
MEFQPGACMKNAPFVALVLLLLATAPAAAQTPGARAQVLAGEFSKLKNVTKTKGGVSHRKYAEVVSEPWTATLRDYRGTYASAEDFAHLNLTIDANGRVSGEGRDSEVFALRDVVIADALLTGTKVYRNGKTAPFEAAFLKRSTRSSPDAEFTTLYGVGFVVKERYDYEVRVFAAKQ